MSEINSFSVTDGESGHYIYKNNVLVIKIGYETALWTFLITIILKSI